MYLSGRLTKATLRDLVGRLRRDRSAIALTEFAMGFPVLLTLGCYGLDVANLAITNLKLSQITLNLADSASRVGVNSSLSTQQMREVDVNDIFQGLKYQGQSIGLTSVGRVILSSLENSGGTQKIHWQRCIGLKSGVGYDSSYGTTTTTAGTDATAGNSGTTVTGGMGPTGAKVTAPTGSGVMFVEVNFLYTPLFSWLSSPARISYTGSFIVRDPRDFSQIYNPSPAAARATCNLYAS